MSGSKYVYEQLGLASTMIRGNTFLVDQLVRIDHVLEGVLNLDHVVNAEESEESFHCLMVVFHVF
jgi:hypothetical protein